jgi:hypothetical protein
MSLSQFLKIHGFSHHPFETIMAEDEKDWKAWFVPPPFLNVVLGLKSSSRGGFRPKSTLVFGRPGSGKTSIRKALENRVIESNPKAMVLRYIDFLKPCTRSVRPSLDDHIEEIIQLGTIELLYFWSENPECYEALTMQQRAELAGLIIRYYESLPPDALCSYARDLSPIGSKLVASRIGLNYIIEFYNSTVKVRNQKIVEPTDWNRKEGEPIEGMYLRLQRFWYLAKAFGVESIWILVDSIDETPNVQDSGRIFDAVAELLLAQRVLEFRDEDKQVICFKVFLTKPEELQPLLDSAGFRKDRVSTEIITWTEQDLAKAFTRRLSHYSNHKVLYFDELCDETAQGSHELLLASCDLRPRTLFMMAQEVLNQYELRDNSSIRLLDKDMVTKGIHVGKQKVFG